MPPPACTCATPSFMTMVRMRDRGVDVAGEVEVADAAGVGAAPVVLQLGDDLHRADLRRAGDGAGGEAGAQRVVGRQAVAQLAGDVRDEVHDVGVALDVHDLRHLHGARAR